MWRAWRAHLWHLCWWTRSARPVRFRGPWCFLTSRLPPDGPTAVSCTTVGTVAQGPSRQRVQHANKRTRCRILWSPRVSLRRAPVSGVRGRPARRVSRSFLIACSFHLVCFTFSAYSSWCIGRCGDCDSNTESRLTTGCVPTPHKFEAPPVRPRTIHDECVSSRIASSVIAHRIIRDCARTRKVKPSAAGPTPAARVRPHLLPSPHTAACHRVCLLCRRGP